MSSGMMEVKKMVSKWPVVNKSCIAPQNYQKDACYELQVSEDAYFIAPKEQTVRNQTLEPIQLHPAEYNNHI